MNPNPHELTREQLGKLMDDVWTNFNNIWHAEQELNSLTIQYHEITETSKPKRDSEKYEETLFKPEEPQAGWRAKLSGGFLLFVIFALFVLSSSGDNGAMFSLIPLSIFWVILSIPLFIHWADHAKWEQKCELEKLDYETRLEEAEKRFQEDLKNWEEESAKALPLVEEKIRKQRQYIQQQKIAIVAGCRIAGLPEAYWSEHAVTHMMNYFKNNRVDTLREAINLYESEKKQDELNAEITRLKEQIEEGNERSADMARQMAQQQSIAAAISADQMREVSQQLSKLQSSQAMLEYYAAMDYANRSSN